MKNWFEISEKWFSNNRMYLYKDLFSEKFIKVYDKNLKRNYYEFIPSDFDIALVEAVANEKSQYTNSNDSYDNKRVQEKKKNKQFEGCLAELAVAKFLINVFGENPSNIHIYDYERYDFNYIPNEEYDVKVIKNNIEKKCEVRNSWSYKTNIFEFCAKYDILGTYTHESKKYEKMSDFFFRPVLQLNDLSNSIPSNSIELVKKRKAKLYIVAACDKKQMQENGTENPRMSQGQTKFHTMKIRQLDSVDGCFKSIYKNSFKIK